MNEFLGEVGGLESECQRGGFHSVPPFVCDKALPLTCYASPGKTLTSLSQVLLGVQGGAKSGSPAGSECCDFNWKRSKGKRRDQSKGRSVVLVMMVVANTHHPDTHELV